MKGVSISFRTGRLEREGPSVEFCKRNVWFHKRRRISWL